MEGYIATMFGSASQKSFLLCSTQVILTCQKIFVTWEGTWRVSKLIFVIPFLTVVADSVPSCSAPRSPPNGQVFCIDPNLALGSTCTFSCDFGRIAVSSIVCEVTEDGDAVWVGETSICQGRPLVAIIVTLHPPVERMKGYDGGLLPRYCLFFVLILENYKCLSKWSTHFILHFYLFIFSICSFVCLFVCL